MFCQQSLSHTALTSILLDITLLFLGLCSQSGLTRGKVLHQYILQHSHKKSNKKNDETINATVQWSALYRDQFSQEVVRCLWWYMISCAQAFQTVAGIRQRVQPLGPEVALPYISKEGLRMGRKKDNKKLGENWFFHSGEHTHWRRHAHTNRLEPCNYWSPTANNRFICRQGFATIIIHWPGQRTAVLPCFVPFTVGKWVERLLVFQVVI